MATRTDIKIFIASSSEMEAERKESVLVIAELNKRLPHLHLEPMLFEFDSLSGKHQFSQKIQDEINPRISEAHIAVVLFYSKLGEFALEEFELALKFEKKIFIYFRQGFMPQNLEEINRYGKVLEFKAKIDEEPGIRYQNYNTLADYNGLLYNELGKYVEETYRASEDTTTLTVSSSFQHIPLAPKPYIAHPYAIVKNFTGRRQEMARLTDWYHYEKEPVCIVEAIGGMGKSALCWRWLQDEVNHKHAHIDGIVWWSFYDQGFEDFIHHLYEYCIPENVREKQQRIDETTEVINALTNHNFLLVLDGFERILRGYAQMTPMYLEDDTSSSNKNGLKAAFDVQQRTPISPKAERLLRALCASESKTLMTTRLFPATLEDIAGINHIELTGLSEADTIAFFKTEEIAGTNEEMIQAGEVYGFHPLMLKLLSTAIKRSYTKNINTALNEAFSQGLIDQSEPQRILSTSYRLLNPVEQKVISNVSVFRATFTFDAVKSLFPDMENKELEGILTELDNLGFLLYSDTDRLFDIHPILRSYLYDGLTAKDSVHQLAITYFTGYPKKENIITLADLEPVIEQYHHLVKAGNYDDASALYITRLLKPLFYQFAQYDLCISLCRQLFTLPSDFLPQISERSNQNAILNHLGLCYASVGKLNIAKEHLLYTFQINDEVNNLTSLAVGLKDLAEAIYLRSGNLSAAKALLKKTIFFVKEREKYHAPDSYRLLSRVLTLQGIFSEAGEDDSAEQALSEVFEDNDAEKNADLTSRIAFHYAIRALAKAKDKEFNDTGLLMSGLQWALQSMNSAELTRTPSGLIIISFVNAYEAVAKSLIAFLPYKDLLKKIPGEVFFYDEYFQSITETINPSPGNCFLLAERCVHEGLAISRKINSVFDECTFLLLLVQMEWLKLKNEQKEHINFKEIEKIATELLQLAEIITFNVLIADLYLLCAEILIYRIELKPGDNKKILGLDTTELLAKARNLARDTSALEDLYLPTNADEFYSDISEYAMLKRGMTLEERAMLGNYTTKAKADRLSIGSQIYISRVKIKNIKNIDSAELVLSHDDRADLINLIIGDNGSGKSTILKSIALALCDETAAAAMLKELGGKIIKNNATQGSIEVVLFDAFRKKDYSIKTFIIQNKDGEYEYVRKEFFPQIDFPWNEIFICAYGPGRNLGTSQTREAYNSYESTKTIFNYNTTLQNPELIFLRQSETLRASSERQIKSILLWENEKHLFEFNQDGLYIDKNPIASLNDGHKSVINWLTDFLGWAILSGKFSENRSIISGILIVDEIEQHLHPIWQQLIIKKLKENFPFVQFIITSHTPLVVAGAADYPDSNLLRIEKGDQGKTVLKKVSQVDILGKDLANILLDAFRMANSFSPGTLQLMKRYAELKSKSDLTESEMKILDDILIRTNLSLKKFVIDDELISNIEKYF